MPSPWLAGAVGRRRTLAAQLTAGVHSSSLPLACGVQIGACAVSLPWLADDAGASLSLRLALAACCCFRMLCSSQVYACLASAGFGRLLAAQLVNMQLAACA